MKPGLIFLIVRLYLTHLHHKKVVKMHLYPKLLGALFCADAYEEF